MIALLALDPGTYKTGVAYFEDARLVDYWLVEVAHGVEIEDRIPALLEAIDELAQAHHVQQVACERLTTLKDRPPPPELATFIARLRRWATRTNKFAWSVYHPSAVVASVRPRGMAGKGSKEIMRAGVQMLYGAFPNDGWTEIGDWGDLDQNVIDAIAVGHCHLSKTHEEAITDA